MKKGYFIWILLGFSIGLMGCQNASDENSQGKEPIRIASSFSILTNIIQEIGGEKVEVHNLVPTGTDPHNYTPTPDDVKFTTTADAIIYNGLNLEGGDSGWLMKLAKSTSLPSSQTYEVTAGVEPQYLTDENNRKEENPHAFISPKVGLKMAENICNSLIEISPENTSYFLKNKKEYVDQLTAIDRKYRETIASIPKERRVFVASEFAFQYVIEEYGLKEGHIWAIDTDKNGTPDQIKNVIQFIKKHKPPVLFVESNVDRRPMETVSEATGVPIYNRPIFSDELGKPGQPADTYIKYLEYNLDVIYDGLK